MVPVWLTIVAWLYLSVCFCCAGIIGYDIVFNRRRQPMGVMNFVFPITALYFGPFALILYRRWGRAPALTASAPMVMSRTAVPQGAAESRGDGMQMHGQHTHHGVAAGLDGADGMAALGEQAFAIAPMRGLGLKDGLIAAAKADFISLTAFEVGLFGWMAVMAFVLFPAPHQLMPSSVAFWLLMQVGMIIGYCSSWPANVWLVSRGIKGTDVNHPLPPGWPWASTATRVPGQ